MLVLLLIFSLVKILFISIAQFDVSKSTKNTLNFMFIYL